MNAIPTIDMAEMTRMAEVTRLTRAGRLMEATALLQGRNLDPAGDRQAAAPHTDASGPFVDLVATLTGQSWGLPETLAPDRGPAGAEPRFETRTFGNAAGSRSYKLFIPSSHSGQPMPLVVMLHGCGQSCDDFAAGTRMNAFAEQQGFLVAYPGQSQSANPQRCWNWFNAADQQRDKGEPSIIAGITRAIVGDLGADPRRVYIAGLSAGGAMAATMAQLYPDLYAAAGVHSGLAHGAAKDMVSAFGAMQGGASSGSTASRTIVPMIVFHGDRDTTVHAANADHVIAQAKAGADLDTRTARGTGPHGTAYTQAVLTDRAGTAVLEQWTLHGASHAWAGGSSLGSFTDPRGIDASREMLRFFGTHAKP